MTGKDDLVLDIRGIGECCRRPTATWQELLDALDDVIPAHGRPTFIVVHRPGEGERYPGVVVHGCRHGP